MNTEAKLMARLADLREQHRLLQQSYQALHEAYTQQEQSAATWLEVRNHELETKALANKQTETLQRVFYQIAERATAGLSLYDFLQVVHSLLNELLYAKNCYVCLYDRHSDTKNFVYYVDERDGDTLQRSNVPFRRGLTEFVLRTAKPQIIDAQRLNLLRQQGEITQDSGDMTFASWLGVPMQVYGVTVGVLTVQGYESDVAYNASDADILSFVGNHVSSAIERHQALDQLRSAESRYRLVIESVGVGVVVVQNERMVFANPSMIEIVGHPMSFLLSQPYTACIHPEDLSTVAARHQRRLRGEPVEPNYGFRVITQAGEVRHLELSAVVIEWNEQAATLLFAVDATARVLAEEDQRVALQKQGELNDMKSRFMSMASHEFRTPLATIQGSTELLRHYDERLNGEQRAQTLEKIDTAVSRMTRMLENVLLIGRADSGKIDFKPQSILFTPFCLALIDKLRGSMAYKSATIGMVYDLPPPDQSYWLDDTLLRNMVGNLISNALKYSPQDSEVFFSANADAHTLTIKVQDQGMGIPQADLPALFQRFHRASNVGHIPGTGLGLAIVKDSVAWHRGTIGVDSELGRGSCFTVTLPINAVQTSTTEPGA